MNANLLLLLAQAGGAGEEVARNFVRLVLIAVPIVIIVGMWKVFTKAGHPGWGCLIPIYSPVVLRGQKGDILLYVKSRMSPFLLPASFLIAARDWGGLWCRRPACPTSRTEAGRRDACTTNLAESRNSESTCPTHDLANRGCNRRSPPVIVLVHGLRHETRNIRGGRNVPGKQTGSSRFICAQPSTRSGIVPAPNSHRRRYRASCRFRRVG